MIMVRITGLILCMSLMNAAFRECGTEPDFDEYIMEIQEYSEISVLRDFPDIVWAPITFHIIRSSEGTGGLPPSRVEQGLFDLLTAYENAGILSYQLGEIDYIDSTEFMTVDSYEEIDELKQINVVPNSINIYSVDYLGTGEYELCGISSFTFSGTQGIVMSNSCFATSDNHSTLAHELGHYFNLYHTHQGSNEPDEDGVIQGPNTEFVDGTQCDTRGDGLCDTSADPILTDLVSGSCEYFGTYVDGHGDLFQPDPMNIMSYSEKWCRTIFSQEQDEKAVYTIFYNRPDLNYPPSEPFIVMLDSILVELSGDGDGVINPNESVGISVSVQNWDHWPVAENVTLSLISDHPEITVMEGEHTVPFIGSGETYSNESDPFIVETGVALGIFDLTVVVTASNPETLLYTKEFSIQLDVSLHQAGWPIIGINQVESSPLVIDLFGDENLGICFGDYDGFFHVVDNMGNELPGFPVDTGDDIWGAPAAGDIDNDDQIEIVVTSKSGHIFVINPAGVVELDYDADQFLMATPALGNMDDDPEMEIVVTGFSNSSKLFVINPDGSDVDGFPLDINEKVMRGAALADFNNNGIDDIVIATENHHLWLIYDDGSIAPGFPFVSEDKFRTAPSIVSFNDTDIILAGCRDNQFYAVNSEGLLLWQIDAGSDVTTSTGFVETDEFFGIFFGTENGSLYGVDEHGVILPGYPQDFESPINVTPSFSDLDGNDEPEIIFANTTGSIFAFNLPGVSMEFFPISGGYEVIGSPAIHDIDGDSDLEIILGTTAGVTVIDVKSTGTYENYWNVYRGNPARTGFFISNGEFECGNPQIGDLNCDDAIDISDIIILMNIILDITAPNDIQLITGDINVDGIVDIIDIIILVNLILNN